MKQTRVFIFFVFLILICVGCIQTKPSEKEIQTAIAQTEIAKPTDTYTPEPTKTPEPTNTFTPQATNTFRPTSTLKPTNTKGPPNTPIPSPTNTQPPSTTMISKNYIGSQESGGIIVEIARVLLAEKSAIKDQNFSATELFDDKEYVIEVVYKVTNNSGKIVTVPIKESSVVINDEQIEVYDYWLESNFGYDFYHEIMPGATVIGGYWLGYKRYSPEEVTRLLFSIEEPYDENYRRIGPAFLIEISVENWGWEELPNELK